MNYDKQVYLNCYDHIMHVVLLLLLNYTILLFYNYSVLFLRLYPIFSYLKATLLHIQTQQLKYD